MERFAGLNIQFQPYRSFLREYFCCALASSVYYLTIAKYPWENFHSTLKIHEILPHRIFPRLWYYDEHIMVD